MSPVASLDQFELTLQNLRICQELVIDCVNQEVTLEGKLIPLTTQENRIVIFMAQRPGQPIRREDLQRELWGPSRHGEGRTIDAYIASIRAKIQLPALIITVRSVGYSFNVAGSGTGKQPFEVVIIPPQE